MESRKGLKCFLRKSFTIVVLLFAVLFSVLRSTNVFAANLGTTELTLRYFTNNGSYNTDNQIYFGRQYGRTIVYGAANIYSFYTSQVQTSGNYAVIHFETNLVISTDDISTIFGYWSNLNEIDILNVYVNGTSYANNIVSGTASTVITDWNTTVNGVPYYNSTLTVYGDVVVGNLSSGSNVIFQVVVGSQNYAFYTNNTDNPDLFYFEQNPMTIDFTSDINNALLQTQINQNNTIINQNNEYYSKEYEAESNISNQTTDDISNAENSQTSSIIGTISSFVSALGTVQTGSCSMTLPFPQFVGGDTVVNPCSGKENAPTLISVASSMFLIGIFVPFAFIVLKMIYNEIRSFTNG